MSRIKCNPEYNRKMNFIIDSPTTDVCDEDSKHAVSRHASKVLKVAKSSKRPISQSPSLRLNERNSLDWTPQSQIRSLFSFRNSGPLKNTKQEIIGSSNASVNSSLPKNPFGATPFTDSQQTSSELGQGQRVSPKKSIRSWIPTSRPQSSHPEGLSGDSGIQVLDTIFDDPTSATFGRQIPPKLAGGVKLRLGASTLDSKIRSHNRIIKGPGSMKFIKEVKSSNLLQSFNPSSTAPKDLEPAEVPLRQLHPRIQTIVVGETPSAIDPSKLQMTGTFKEKTLTLSSRPKITVIKTSSSSQMIVPQSSMVVSQSNLGTLSRGGLRFDTNSSIIKPPTKDQLPLLGESQSVLNIKDNSGAIPELGHSRNKQASEMGASSPSKDSNPFLRSVPNFDEVVLSPTYKKPTSELISEDNSPQHQLPNAPRVLLDSNQDLQEILQANTPFMEFVRKQTETKEKVNSFVRQQSQKRFVGAVGQLIAQSLGLKEEGEESPPKREKD